MTAYTVLAPVGLGEFCGSEEMASVDISGVAWVGGKKSPETLGLHFSHP